jgi:putative aldouronate transport system permease protein
MTTARIPPLAAKNKIQIGSRAVDIIIIIFFVLLSVVFIYPFLNVIAISLSSHKMIGTGTITFYPKEFNIKGYLVVFGEAPIYKAYGWTLLYCFMSAFISLSCTSFIAYALAQGEFILKKPLTVLLLITMFFSGGTVPTYLVVQDLGLMNTPWALVLPNAVSAYNVFVYRAFFKGISGELREAALIDGAGDFRILFKIYYPLSKALFATFGLFAIVGMWNSYYDALLYIKNDARHPIQMILRTILFKSGASGGTFGSDANLMMQTGAMNPKNVQYATIVATIGPILAVYPFVQKHFTQGIQVGAVKG